MLLGRLSRDFGNYERLRVMLGRDQGGQEGRGGFDGVIFKPKNRGGVILYEGDLLGMTSAG
jgi:hypothetical protein